MAARSPASTIRPTAQTRFQSARFFRAWQLACSAGQAARTSSWLQPPISAQLDGCSRPALAEAGGAGVPGVPPGPSTRGGGPLMQPASSTAAPASASHVRHPVMDAVDFPPVAGWLHGDTAPKDS
ncbi:hypothetical protein D3C72_1032050 [compost metagenome]